MLPETIHDKKKERKHIKKTYYFYPWNLPENFMTYLSKELKLKIRKSYEEANNPLNYPTGCITYENFYTHTELNEIEKNIEHSE